MLEFVNVLSLDPLLWTWAPTAGDATASGQSCLAALGTCMQATRHRRDDKTDIKQNQVDHSEAQSIINTLACKILNITINIKFAFILPNQSVHTSGFHTAVTLP